MQIVKQHLKTNHPEIARIVWSVGNEIRTMAAHWRGRLSRRQQRTLRSLRRSSGLKLNIASGRTNIPGWINIDVSPGADIQMDLRRPIPLPSGSVAMIFCEHFCDLLHFPHEISRFLTDCHRLLEPGGRARFVMHDAEGLMRACIERDTRYFDVAGQTQPTMMKSVNYWFYSHRFLYDYETFERLLLVAGFVQVLRCKYRESKFQDLPLDLVQPAREVMSMYIEAST